MQKFGTICVHDRPLTADADRVNRVLYLIDV